jgi:hypothetical protein
MMGQIPFTTKVGDILNFICILKFLEASFTNLLTIQIFKILCNKCY